MGRKVTTSPSIKNIQLKTIEDSKIKSSSIDQTLDNYTLVITTLATWADTLEASGQYELQQRVMEVLNNIIKDHEEAEEQRREKEKIEQEEEKIIQKKYLQKKILETINNEKLLIEKEKNKKVIEKHFIELHDKLKKII